MAHHPPISLIFLLVQYGWIFASSVEYCDTNSRDIERYDYNNVKLPVPTRGLLYPRESETREVRSLNGIWNFRISSAGDNELCYKNELKQCGSVIDMPVPASYNDITTSAELRDHVGPVWYERTFFVPIAWSHGQRIWLRFGSVHYRATVWLNGDLAMKHEFGHLPFEAEITNLLKFGNVNRLTVLCDNVLKNDTIPQGEVINERTDNGTINVQTYTFDFFNYAGIHRTVHLYTTPTIYIEDVIVNTQLYRNGTGLVIIKFATNILKVNNIDAQRTIYMQLQLRDKVGKIVSQATIKPDIFQSTLIVPNAMPWWPYLMHSESGYMYNLELYLRAADKSLLDVYRLPVGIRTLTWSNTSLQINGKSLYMRGFGKHEDADIRGKGLDLALIVHDMNLIKWIGANAYRTSHYPYSEESMQLADEHGIMIIDECPSVNTAIFQPELLQKHMSALEQLIHRDRNHPSVIAWSIANEPRSTSKQAEIYFGILTNYTRNIAAGRPITAAINAFINTDKLAQFLDIISFNRYNAWYQNEGHLNMITKFVVDEANAWHALYKKPVVMSEYGADTLEGFHMLPASIWSEDYQSALFSKHFKAFDRLRQKSGWFIGEFVWNFADFKTDQKITRVGGNKKGIFTRTRQPKNAAKLLRQRYYALAHELQNVIPPNEVFPYIINWP